jgi:hypothetical protein
MPDQCAEKIILALSFRKRDHMSQLDSDSEGYAGPEAGLLSCGEPADRGPRATWLNYRDFGLGEANIPDLVRMATDQRLHMADTDSAAVWAPLHAWRALAQLGATDAAEPLLRLAERFPEDDWVAEDLPVVLSMLGSDILTVLTRFVGDGSIDTLGPCPR